MSNQQMKAIVTTGNGDYDCLVYKEVAKPQPGTGEVLIKVLAAGVNNTEINTRLGWYSSAVTDSTNAAADDGLALPTVDGGWNKATPFPFIQGTDCCGEVVQMAEDVSAHLLGKRVLVRSCIREHGFQSLDNIWMGSDFDGAFAQYVTVAASEVFAVDCDWSDAELGTIPCAYGTSENMLHRAKVGPGDTVLVTGASGGVGSATVQLAKRRGAKVIAVAGRDKHQAMAALGVDVLLGRDEDLMAILQPQSVDVVVDNVAGSDFPNMMKLLKRGGRLVSSGAIAGPVVALDMRDLYLKDIRIIGSTSWDEPIFPNLVGYIERGEIKPLLAHTFPLKDIVKAQKLFITKQHVGKFVLLPDHG